MGKENNCSIDEHISIFAARILNKHPSRLCIFFRPKFGRVYELTKVEFVGAIDLEKPQVTVIVHIYENVRNRPNGIRNSEFVSEKF